MSLKEFGTDISVNSGFKTDQDFVDEIYELVGRKFDMSIIVVEGKVIYFSYDTEIKTGGTTPVETGQFVKIEIESADLDENGDPIIVEVDSDVPELDYVEDYEYHELTPEQLEILNTWVSENVEA